MEVCETVQRTFDAMELAFIYVIAVMASNDSDLDDRRRSGPASSSRVLRLLSQAGYDVASVEGSKGGTRRAWLEVGFHGHASEVIVDMSAPECPRRTVLLKRSRVGRSYVPADSPL